MTAVETLERAISKLETLRDGCKSELPLRSGFYGSGGIWPEGTELEDADGFQLMRVEAEDSHLLHLIADLSRTVEHQIALMRSAIREYARWHGAVGQWANEAYRLARAILGEEQS